MENSEVLKIRCYKNLFGSPKSIMSMFIGLIAGNLICYTILSPTNTRPIWFFTFGILFGLLFGFIIYQFAFSYYITMTLKNHGLSISLSDERYNVCNPKYEKYIIFNPNKPKTKPVLVLELWIDKELIVIWETLKKDMPSNLPVYLKTNINNNYSVIDPGSIDRITDFINSFQGVKSDANL